MQILYLAGFIVSVALLIKTVGKGLDIIKEMESEQWDA